MYKSNHLKTTSFFALSALTIALFSNYSHAEEKLEEIKVTAEAQVKQSLGSSLITAKDFEKRPATNDISEVLRTHLQDNAEINVKLIFVVWDQKIH